MKRTIALLLCVVMVFSFMLVSCGNVEDLETLAGKTPEELYAASQQKLKDYDRIKVVAEQTITMTMEGATFEMPQSVTSIMDGQNSYFHQSSQNAITGTIDNEGWYIDGILYSNTPAGKFCAELPWETYITDYLGSDPSETTLLNIPESWFKDVSFTKKDGSDNYYLVFKVSGDKYEEVMSNVGLEGIDNIGDVEYTVEFDKEGNLLGVETVFDMTVSGVSASCVSTSKVYVDGVDAVTAPADKDQYQSVNLQ